MLVDEYARKYLSAVVSHLPGNGITEWRKGDRMINGARVEIKTQLAAAKTGNLCLEHISQEDHTAPLVIDLIPIFIVSKRSDRQHIIDSWPDRRPGGDDKRAQTIFPLPFDIVWKKDDAYASNFKRI